MGEFTGRGRQQSYILLILSIHLSIYISLLLIYPVNIILSIHLVNAALQYNISQCTLYHSLSLAYPVTPCAGIYSLEAAEMLSHALSPTPSVTYP